MARLMSPTRSALDSLRTPLTPGEWAVLDFFDRHLPPDWEIYVQPHLNGHRPDFVLLHPRVGIAVFEVKDWDLDALEYAVDERRDAPPVLIARDQQGKRFRRRDNPVDKVREYREAILELYCPRLAIRANQDGRIVAVVTAGVIMPATTTERATRLLEPSRRHHRMLGVQARYFPVAGGDALAAGDLTTVFPEALRAGSYIMSPQLADDLRSWLVEPDFAATQRQPLPLDSRQQELARTRTATGYRRIKGPAGSGKSMVLSARAAQLSAEGRDVLVITFNRTLWHYLRDLAVRHPAPGRDLCNRITWRHFHEWCKCVCYEAGLEDEYHALWSDLPRDRSGQIPPELVEEVLERQLPDLAERALTIGADLIQQYDALLVDEGQDFNLEWWNLLRRVVRPGGEYVLVADETQDLYDRTRSWTDDSMAGAGFRGDWSRLTASYRLPPTLVPLLRAFVEQYLPTPERNLPEAEQLELMLYPVRLRWLQVPPEHATDVCVEAVASLPAGGDTLAFSDVTLLVESHDFGLRCVELLGEKGIRCAHVFGETWQQQKNNKLAFYKGDARVKASTIHSFKGWETRAVVVHLGNASDLQALATAYVGLSRLKRHEQESFMTVVCSAPELELYGRGWPDFESRSSPILATAEV